MLGQLLAYDDDGNVIASLDFLVKRAPDGSAIGVHDFGAEEAAGYEFDTEAHDDGGGVWHVDGARGSKVWPQWLREPGKWRVERDGPPGRTRAAAIVHRETGERRSRDEIDGAIAERLEQARETGRPADLRDLVGGPSGPPRGI